ncbi:hypothetical protein LCGC14_0621960 [marine sediment metagenome]|uniref:Uncharacterized protein n=1 Tax=marine sediment metagenome TaxID=412755 RepID=A0A0F9R9J3_9ZZZZ|nr:hypothetical protein [Pricia sp.]
MSQKEVKDLLVEYCEWCKAQGGQCQLNLDGCSIGEALAILNKEQPEPSKGRKEAEHYISKCSPTDYEGMKLFCENLKISLYEAFDHIDRLESKEQPPAGNIFEIRIPNLKPDEVEIVRVEINAFAKQLLNNLQARRRTN